MNGSSDVSIGQKTVEGGSFPDSLTTGKTVLIATAGNPSRSFADLHVLCQYGHAIDTALVVTTTERADHTIESYENLCPRSDRPSLKLVDTVSKRQSVSALYEETPVIFTPSPGDLERLLLAVSDLSENCSPIAGARHLVIRSLTPLLKTSPTTRVCTVLERITGLRSETGLCLLGFDYTAHSEETMEAIAEHVDGILWVAQPCSGQLEFVYHPAKGRHTRSGR